MGKSANEPFRQAEGTKIKTIGILTGGGDCPGLNSVIRAVTKSATLNYGWKVLGVLDGFEGLIQRKSKSLSFEDVRGIIAKGGTILGSNNRTNPFEYKVKEGKEIHSQDLSGRVVENISSLKIDALVVVGGDGTLSIGNKLSKMGVPIIGVPKTIDNDLPATDSTFGFDTAVNTAVEAIDKIRTTAESHHRVMIVEVMGRTAGWIALGAGTASGADIILIPEIPYEPENVCSVIKERMSKKRNYSIVVVAEGSKPKDGREVVKMFVKDSAEAIRLGGIGTKLAADIREKLNIETRATILGHIQRGGSPSASDRILGTRLGFHATELISEGKFGTMSALKGMNITEVTLDEATKSIKKVDPEGELVRCAKMLGVSFGD